MKIAEALQHRRDVQNKIEELRQRLINNAKYQEGQAPAEDMDELITELNQATEELANLIYRINLTNSQTKTEMGTLTELLAKRDALRLKRSVYVSFTDEASEIAPRYSQTEIMVRPSIDVRKFKKEIDEISKTLREYEFVIQEKNWTTNLL